MPTTSGLGSMMSSGLSGRKSVRASTVSTSRFESCHDCLANFPELVDVIARQADGNVGSTGRTIFDLFDRKLHAG